MEVFELDVVVGLCTIYRQGLVLNIKKPRTSPFSVEYVNRKDQQQNAN